MQSSKPYATGGCLWQGHPRLSSFTPTTQTFNTGGNPIQVPQRIAQEMMELEEYNFKLVHIKGRENGQADALSRWPSYNQGEEDNEGVVVLPNHLFV